MKKVLIFACIALVTSVSFAGNGAIRQQIVESGTDYVPCLDVTVMWTVIYSAVIHEVWDGSGGYHSIGNVRWTGEYDAEGSDMSWSSRGAGPLVLNFNGNNEQGRQTFRSNEVIFANGDYPDLHFTFEFSGTQNANGELVTLRMPLGTFRCMPN